MGTRSKRARIGIQNLGEHARKKKKVEVSKTEENPSRTRTVADTWQEQAKEALQRFDEAFSEVRKPTWAQERRPPLGNSGGRVNILDTHDPCAWRHVAIEEELDIDILAARVRSNDPLLSKIPPGWVLHVDDIEDDEGLQEEPAADSVSSSSGGAARTGIDTEAAHGDPESTPTRPKYRPAPSILAAKAAHGDLVNLLHPRRKSGKGRLHFRGDDHLLRRMEQMRMLLYRYTNGISTWMAGSIEVARDWEKGEYQARQLRAWTRDFIDDRHALPHSRMGTWNESLLDKKPDLKAAISTHLMGVGTYVRALDIVEFLQDPEIQLQYGLAEGISLSTAQVWMHKLDYRWTRAPRGQFVDGHERSDVVHYRNSVFLPAIEHLEPRLRQWAKNGSEIPVPAAAPRPLERRVVLWYHDESTFYAHDRRETRWVAKEEKVVPRKKGEGVSLMVADFVSADYGWLSSPDGKESARVFFKAGKNREGYFTNEEILDQATNAMNILQRHYPNEEHILIYDNAPTHLKRAADALSARHMSLRPTAKADYWFGVEVPTLDEETKKPVYDRDGKIMKHKIAMTGATFADGSPQSLYFPDDHPRAGVFKGMAILLQERGISISGLRAECPGFKCPPPAVDCCCRRILYNQPDFRDIESLLEIHCRSRGVQVLFLPKFHCELNPIEQCWGKAKREYRMYPPSSLEADLERNVKTALESVDTEQIRKYCRRTHRFMQAYRLGLTGKAAAFAERKYKGHRVLPWNVLEELDKDGKKELVGQQITQ